MPAVSSRGVTPGTWGGGADLCVRWGGRPGRESPVVCGAGLSFAHLGRGRRRKACVLDGRGTLQRRLPRAAVGGRLASAPPRVQGLRSPACRRGPWGLRPRPGLPRPGKTPKQLLSPNLCTSHVPTPPPLPCACACVYSSPSRRTPKCWRANPENRILRKTQEVRQTI